MHRSTAVLAIVSGLAFALFPLLRPWGDTTGSALATAEAFASPLWIASHASGMLGWVALAAAAAASAQTRAGRTAAWLLAGGTACVLPYYGAETFGLHGLARYALAAGDPSLVGAEALVRGGAVQMTLFGIGLLVLSAGGVVLALAGRRSAGGPGATVPLAVLVALYLPQFFLAPGVRIAHGILLGLALVLWAVLRRSHSRAGHEGSLTGVTTSDRRA